MLIVFPIGAFLLLLVLVIGVRDKVDQGSVLIASIFWGTLVALSAEGLSIFSAITKPWIAGFWIGAVLLLLGLGLTRGTFRRALTAIRALRLRLEPFDWTMLGGTAALLGTLAAVGWLTPPNNTDSLSYHMPRIAHWIQNANLNHYPTHYQHQLWASPFAEIGILHLKILWGGDAPVKSIQWISLVGSIVGVTGIAGLLGADRRGRWLSAAFAVSIPMAVLQSTTAQTDLVTAFWLICLAYFVVLDKRSALTRLEWLSFALASGLGLLTKGTFPLFALPVLVWFFLPYIQQFGWKKTFFQAMGVGAVMIAINLGFLTRNMISYRNPLGPAVEGHANLSLQPLTWVSNVIRQGFINYATPWPNVNEKIVALIDSIDRILGIELHNFSLTWSWNHEDLAGSPIHFAVVIFSLFLLIYRFRRKSWGDPQNYALVTFFAFIVFSSITRFNVFTPRLQLPFLLLGAPALGLVVTSPSFQHTFGFGFLLLSLPWLLFNNTRPIVAMRPNPEPLSIPCIFGCTRTGSIFLSTKEDILFANWPDQRRLIEGVNEIIQNRECREVGLRLDSYDNEYLIWAVLEPGTKIESVFAYPELERYIDPSFKPCAVICTTCRGKTRVHGLEQVTEYQRFGVYAGEGFSPDVDG